MLTKGSVMGVLYVQSSRANRFSQADAELLTLVGNTAAIAIQNARLFAVTQRRVERLTTLHAIDTALSSTLDMRVTLNILLDQLIALLNVDAADILMFDSAPRCADEPIICHCILCFSNLICAVILGFFLF